MSLALCNVMQMNEIAQFVFCQLQMTEFVVPVVYSVTL